MRIFTYNIRSSGNMQKVYRIRKGLLGKNYFAICLFGLICAVRPLSPVELNHEKIHAAQQRELLYLPFFLWYGVEWLLLFCKYRNWEKAYFMIRFEQEAYRHQTDLDYLQQRKHYRYNG